MRPFRFLLPLIVLAFGLSACHEPAPAGLVTIDIDEALNNKGELRLSEIATDVEFVPLHGMSTDTYVHSWSWQYFVGEKVICVFNVEPPEFLLFSRDGKFIRKIGNSGKGPGEFIGSQTQISVDEANETILLADNTAKKFLLYRFSGQFIKERTYNSFPDAFIAICVGICPDKQGNFVINNHRSRWADKVCYDILILDQDLNLKKGIKPENPLTGSRSFYFGFNVYPFGNNIRFWTPGRDTLFELIKDQPFPIYYFKIADPPSTEERMTSDNRGHIVLERILETNNYFLIYGNQGSNPFYLSYHKPTGKTVQLFATGKCGPSFRDNVGIENDLFGFSPVIISEGTTICNDKLIVILHPGIADFIDEWLKGKFIDCLRSADVLLPDKRDELVKLIENLDEDSGPILMEIRLK
jgi:hypothetical protein